MLTSEPAPSVRLPGQQADILPGSPTAVLAVFTEIVRERFRPGGDLPWYWDGNLNPANDAQGTSGSARKVLIEPGYSETAEVRNYRPAIYIDRMQTVPNKAVLANFVGQHLPTGLRAFHSLVTIPLAIQVEASRKGESATLADAVWFYLLSGIEPIRATFDIHEITMPELGRTELSDKDKATWVTPITFAITTNLRWTTVPVSSTIREVVARTQDSKLLHVISAGR